MKISGAEMVVQSLEKEGTKLVFGIPGGTVLPLYDALYEAPFTHVLMRHEQAACHAAEGYARSTGEAGVCIVTSGPGATNAVTGLSNAMFDSIPLVLIAGHVATPMMGTDAFQEADIFGSSLSFVKHGFYARKVEHIPQVFRDAFALAKSGRPGPVLIILPSDIQRMEGEFEYPEKVSIPLHPGTWLPAPAQMRKAAQLIRESSKPVLLAGGGTGSSRVSSILRGFAEKYQIPVATTLMGKGSFPESSPLSLGMAGMHGKPQANLAISNCDLLIAAGTRFSDRTTANLKKFAPSAKIIHIDIDEAEFDKILRAEICLTGDAGIILKDLSSMISEKPVPSEWLSQIDYWKSSYSLDPPEEILSAPLVIRRVREKTGADMVVTTEVGQNQMWAALHWTSDAPGKFITSGGLGTMGFGLPAAMGASFGMDMKPVVCIAGDGSLLMNIQEFETCARYNLPVKIFLLNNSTLGMVRQWQELFAKERYSHTITNNSCDFPKIAEACGIKGMQITNAEDLDSTIEAAFHHNGPVLVDCRIDTSEKVMPMVPPGKGLADFMYK